MHGWAVADLILLSLQLCLGSDSRHVPGGKLSARGLLARFSKEENRLQKARRGSVRRRKRR